MSIVILITIFAYFSCSHNVTVIMLVSNCRRKRQPQLNGLASNLYRVVGIQVSIQNSCLDIKDGKIKINYEII
jgi:hypothetical protein